MTKLVEVRDNQPHTVTNHRTIQQACTAMNRRVIALEKLGYTIGLIMPLRISLSAPDGITNPQHVAMAVQL